MAKKGKSRRPRSGVPVRKRRRVRDEKITCLLVGEGKKTEYNYLKSLSDEPLVKDQYAVTVRRPSHASPVRLVRKAVDLRNEARNDPTKVLEGYDDVWCVLDVETPRNLRQLQKALAIAQENDIQLCLSNPCFEVWFLAHFVKTHREFSNAADATGELGKRWRGRFKQDYSKADKRNYERLRPLLDEAIKNAQSVRESAHGKAKHIVDCNSSTDVYELVSKLLGKEEES